MELAFCVGEGAYKIFKTLTCRLPPPENQHKRTYRACRQKCASGEPTRAHLPRLSTEVHLQRTKTSELTAPVDRSMLPENQHDTNPINQLFIISFADMTYKRHGLPLVTCQANQKISLRISSEFAFCVGEGAYKIRFLRQ